MVPMMVLLLNVPGQAGDKKASAWKAFLPIDSYIELNARSRKIIKEAVKSDDKNAKARIWLEFAFQEGYMLSLNWAGERTAKSREAVLAARKKELKELAEFGATIPVVPKRELEEFKTPLPPLADLMEIFRPRAKGGEELHADLQYVPKLKNQGIGALIGTLQAKKISEANLAKIAKELPNLAYRIAVVASLTHELAPAKGAGEWRDLSIKMRDASIALADAAQKKNADGVFTAAQSLESSCTQCHSAFKGK
jgi:hypothetical protein